MLQSLDGDYDRSEGGVAGEATIACLIFLLHIHHDLYFNLVMDGLALDITTNSWASIRHNTEDLSLHGDH